MAVKSLTTALNADVVTGDASQPIVTAYSGTSLTNGDPSVLFNFDAFPELNSGVYVG